MTAIMKRELGSYFNSAIGYIVLAVFYFFSGMFFYLYCLLSNTASMNYLFLSMLMIVMLIIPIITMRSFSEEKRQKTDQALLTAPVSLTEIVMGKFLGAFLLYCMCNAIYILYAIILAIAGHRRRSADIYARLYLGRHKRRVDIRHPAQHLLRRSLHQLHQRYHKSYQRGLLPLCHRGLFVPVRQSV